MTVADLFIKIYYAFISYNKAILVFILLYCIVIITHMGNIYFPSETAALQ